MDNREFQAGGALATIGRLAVISLIVGIVLSALGITPANFFHSINVLARRLYDLGFGAIDWVLQYLLVGALVVVPVYVVARVLGLLKNRAV